MDATPSLVTALRETQADAFILDGCGDYSTPHILTAAQIAARAGKPFILLGDCGVQSQYLLQCHGGEALEEMLKKPVRTPAKAPQAPRVLQELRTPRQAPEGLPYRVKPLGAGVGGAHLVTVGGSQARIGCTTQCLQLYHYFHALGFAPAIMVTEDHLARLRSVLENRRTDTGVVFLEEVPFLPVSVGMQPPYDLFLEDCGVLEKDKLKDFLDGEMRVVVAGSKPWEIQRTMAAMRMLKGHSALAVLLSFSSNSDVKQLREALKMQEEILLAPWQPSPFISGDLRPYDRGLRHAVERIFSKNEREEQFDHAFS